jgi:hypothetical protein
MTNHRAPKWMEFQPCSRCEYDFATGEGERACSYGDCAYLPEALDVFCEQCRFNYLTMEGNSGCDDPSTCEHAAVPLGHVENYRRWATARGLGIAERLA